MGLNKNITWMTMRVLGCVPGGSHLENVRCLAFLCKLKLIIHTGHTQATAESGQPTGAPAPRRRAKSVEKLEVYKRMSYPYTHQSTCPLQENKVTRCSHIAGTGWRPVLLLTFASHTYLALYLHPLSSCPEQQLPCTAQTVSGRK